MNFYGLQSAIKIGVSLFKSTMQIEIAPAYDKNRKSARVQKGEKVFNWEDGKSAFSLATDECVNIISNWDKIVQDTYTNPNEKDERYKNTFSVTHFKENKPTRFILSPQKSNGKLSGLVNITISSGTTNTYTLKGFELTEFKLFIENCARYLNFASSIHESIKVMQWFDKKNKTEKSSGSSGYQSDNSTPNYQEESNSNETNTEFNFNDDVAF